MLVQPDINELGDKRLNPEEGIAREREELLNIAASRKIWGQKELEDQERSAGPRMAWQEVLRRILKCNPDLKVKDGSEGSVAIYRRKKPWEYDGSEDITLQPKRDSFFLDHLYVTGMKKEPLPEYSHVTVDTSLLPVRETRGWRTLLIALIKSGAIKYEQAIAEFGDPSGDSRSSRWFIQLKDYRKV